MAYTKKKVVLGATDNSSKDAFNRFNEFVINIIYGMIDNKTTGTRELAKVIGECTIRVYLKSVNGEVTVIYNTGSTTNISKTFTKKTDVKKEFDKLTIK